MFEIGENVVYGVHGVCRVVGLEDKKVDRKNLRYLVLEPIDQSGSKYLVPADNPSAMGKLSPVLTKEELENLLDSEDARADGWIPEENRRRQSYRSFIISGDRVKLMQMVRGLHRHKLAQTAAGRKCHLCDENFLHDGEKLLVGEVSIVLNMEPEQAKNYLKTRLYEEC